MKAEVQGLGAVKVSHWGVQSMEVRVLIWVSEHCFGRWRKGGRMEAGDLPGAWCWVKAHCPMFPNSNGIKIDLKEIECFG